MLNPSEIGFRREIPRAGPTFPVNDGHPSWHNGARLPAVEPLYPSTTGVSTVEKNIGTQDRNIRYAAGALLILAALLNWSSFWWLGLIGVIAIGTAYMGTCLAYIPFKINTKKAGE